MDLEDLRTALIITLSIVVVVLLARRFRESVLRRDLPVRIHVEIRRLEVAYHPARLRVQVHVPKAESVRTSILDMEHHTIHSWGEESLDQGLHELERTLPELQDGFHYLEMSSDTQRTVRRFRLQRA